MRAYYTIVYLHLNAHALPAGCNKYSDWQSHPDFAFVTPDHWRLYYKIDVDVSTM